MNNLFILKLPKILKILRENTDIGHFPSSLASEMASLSNSGGKPVNNVQIDPLITDIWSTKLSVTL